VVSETPLFSAEPPPGGLDRNGLVVLSRDECLELLGTVRLGRVGLSMRALPVVMPVCFALLGDDIVFRSGTGTKLSAAVDHTIVAFEADQVDVDEASRWSVCVTGRASTLHRPDDLAAVAALDLAQFVRGPPSHVVRIWSDIVTGRRLLRHG
jgi:nitroimidazol reductase NimA-like FMN-containing flavoprotein (pyridoxamine 5'-phosphate oxidase superfamily)